MFWLVKWKIRCRIHHLGNRIIFLLLYISVLSINGKFFKELLSYLYRWRHLAMYVFMAMCVCMCVYITIYVGHMHPLNYTLFVQLHSWSWGVAKIQNHWKQPAVSLYEFSDRQEMFKHVFVDPVDSLKLTALSGFSWNLAPLNMHIQDRTILGIALVFWN